MANNFNVAHVKTFEANVRHLAQQTESHLRSLITERKGPSTSGHSFPRLAKRGDTMVQKTGRLVDTPNADSVWSNRVAVATKWHDGETYEKEDLVQALVDPESNLCKSIAAACQRKIDDLIIDAADADALTDFAGTTVALPTSQIIGDGSEEFGFSTITLLNQKYLENDIEPSERKALVIGPVQARALLHEARATSHDYVGPVSHLMSNGYIKSFLGFDFILSNRLASYGAGRLTCLSFTEKAFGELCLEDIYVKIAEDPTKSFTTRIYYAFNMGFVRIEDEHVFVIDVKNSLTLS